MVKITDFRLPNYWNNHSTWEKWRAVYESGEKFRRRFLKQFSTRESSEEFADRLAITPIPSFAKAAVNDIRNAIFQRMVNIVRKDGSESYHRAIGGHDMGVDQCGSSMNAFIGQKVLEELLVMGKVGVFIDAPQVEGPTLAHVGDFRPYLYPYKIEDILSYACDDPARPSEFRSILLRDTITTYDSEYGLPSKEVARYRRLWIDGEGYVSVQFYDEDNNPTDANGNASGEVRLGLRRIPFVLLDIGDSLIKDASEYQIALLNLVSSDVNYALKANFPFYTEQRDLRNVGSHLKSGVNPDGTATSGGQGAHDREVTIGTRQGRFYPMNADRPDFIHPSSEPLEASMNLQDKFEKDIRKLVNLAVQTLATRESAESKEIDNQGLDAGLSFIGLVLESAERQIAEHWTAYEKNTQVATIKYPDRYSLKSDSERIDEASSLSKVIQDTPSKTARKELWKTVITTLLGGRVNPDVISEIFREIDGAKFTTSNPEVIQIAKEAGLVGEQLASMALGFPEEEYLQARKDHTARLRRIAETQGVNGSTDSAARGVKDLSDDPANAGSEEKAASRDTTLRDTTEDRTRGKGHGN